MDVLNRVTKQFLKSVNTPDYPESEWIRAPDLSATNGYHSKYWVIVGDSVFLISKIERDALDSSELEAGKDAAANRINIDPYLNAFARVVLDEINILRSTAGLPARTLSQLETAVRSKV